MKKLYIAALTLGSLVAVAGPALAGPGCGQGGAARFETLDQDKDGKVTLAELTSEKERWLDAADTNKDDLVSKDEMRASHQVRAAERGKKILEKKDTNGDGQLSAEESQMPPRWFSRLDTDGNGSLTLAELSARPSHAKGKAKGNKRGKEGSAGKHKAGKAHGPMAQMDENGDGQISRQEVRNAAARMLERFDGNSDGSLSADEMPARYGKGRHGGHRGGKASTHAPQQGQRS